MHTTIIPHEGEEFVFLHNGDFSGDVRVVWPKGRTAVVTQGADRWFQSTIPADVLLELVGRWLSQEHIDRIELQSGVEYLRELIT